MWGLRRLRVSFRSRTRGFRVKLGCNVGNVGSKWRRLFLREDQSGMKAEIKAALPCGARLLLRLKLLLLLLPSGARRPRRVDYAGILNLENAALQVSGSSDVLAAAAAPARRSDKDKARNEAAWIRWFGRSSSRCKKRINKHQASATQDEQQTTLLGWVRESLETQYPNRFSRNHFIDLYRNRPIAWLLLLLLPLFGATSLVGFVLKTAVRHFLLQALTP